MLRTSIAAACMAVAVGLSQPAMATLVTDGSDVTVAWDQAVTGAGGFSAEIQASAEFSGFVFNPNGSVTFHVDISNTTLQGSLSAADWASIRLVSFGFDTNPDASSISDTSTVFNTALNVILPGFQTVDACAYSGNSCPGGANTGLRPIGSGVNPETDSFDITMLFPAGTTSFDFGIGVDEIVGAKFQTGGGSFELSSTIVEPPCIPGTPGCVNGPPLDVAEPASLAILGSGLLGLGLIRRVRRRRED